MTTSVTLMKCACSTCLCVLSTDKAVEKEGKYYCSEGCAEGHKTIKNCSNAKCGCA
ncbi:MAG: metallothionein [Calothrix sp. SM1_7_51]|nr:metallothionein [Calothrix sp. SM1_7_51]